MSPLPGPLKPQPPARAELEIFNARLSSHVLSQQSLTTADQRQYRLFIATPRLDAPRDGVNFLYMLDGNAVFDTLTPELLSRAPGLFIVGIGYETPLRFDRAARSLDYTPADDGAPPRPDPQYPDRMIGGAAAFLDRLAGEIVPMIEANAGTGCRIRTLWGHSLAGMCTLYSLLRGGNGFQRHVAVSPSLWWRNEFLLRMEEALPRAPLATDTLVMLGDSERRSSPQAPHWNGPAPHTLEMIRRLESRGGGKVTSQVFAGAGHAATLAASLEATLRYASRP